MIWGNYIFYSTSYLFNILVNLINQFLFIGRLKFKMDKPGFKSKNQYGSFITDNPIGTPPQYETIDSTEVIKIKKKLKDCPGLNIYEYGKKGSGRYTIKLKVEKDGEIIQEDLAYSKDNLSTMLKKYDIAMKTLFPNRITDKKFKELRLLNDKLTDSEFADLLNENDYLTNKGNKFTSISAFNYKKRLKIGSLGPRKYRTIKEAKNIVIEKLRKTSKIIAQNPKNNEKIKFKRRLVKILEKRDSTLIFAKATQLINDEKK